MNVFKLLRRHSRADRISRATRRTVGREGSVSRWHQILRVARARRHTFPGGINVFRLLWRDMQPNAFCRLSDLRRSGCHEAGQTVEHLIPPL